MLYRVEAGYVNHVDGEMLIEDEFESDDFEEFEDTVAEYRMQYDFVDTFKNGVPFRLTD